MSSGPADPKDRCLSAGPAQSIGSVLCAIAWVKERGAEFAEVTLDGTSLRAAGVAVSADPLEPPPGAVA